jgi:hypothetical protein
MAKFIIADEIDNSKTADVLASGALETVRQYVNFFVNSGTACATATSAPCLLHTITVQSSANLGQLIVGDCSGTTTVSNATSADVVAKIDLAARGSYLFDTIISKKLAYRLTGLDCDGITISYQLI